jgi:amino acid transporter
VVYAGKAGPLVFILALLATLPTALSYAFLARELPSSGSAFEWARKSINAPVGAWVGCITAIYYLMNVVLQPITFGLFARDLLEMSGVQGGFASWLGGALLSTAVCGWLVYRGIQPSTKGALGFLMFEMAVIFALALTVVAVQAPRGLLDATPFLPSSSPQGASGIFQGLVFALLTFCGFDVISTVAEESHTPRTLIPRAMMLSLVVFAAFVVFHAWVFTFSQPLETIAGHVRAGKLPVTEIARQYWGRGFLLVVGTGLSATLGVFIATAVGASRVLYAMAREGYFPAALAHIHPQSQVPVTAYHWVFGGSLAAAMLGVFLLGPYPAYLWWGAASVFFAMLTFLAVNLTNFLYYYRYRRDLFHPVWNGVIPAIGMVFDSYVLYKSFFQELLAQDWKQGKSVVVVSLLLALAAAAFSYHKGTKGTKGQ